MTYNGKESKKSGYICVPVRLCCTAQTNTHCKSIILPQKFYKWRRKYQLLSPSGWEGCGSDDGQKQMSWAAAVAGWVQGWGEEQARWQLGFWLECLVDGASLRRNGLRVCGERAFRAKGQWGISGAVKIPGRHHSWVMRNGPTGGRTSQDSGHGSWRGSRFQVGQREDEIRTGTWPWGWQLAAGGCRESRFHAVGWCPGVQWIEGWLGWGARKPQLLSVGWSIEKVLAGMGWGVAAKKLLALLKGFFVHLFCFLN